MRPAPTWLARRALYLIANSGPKTHHNSRHCCRRALPAGCVSSLDDSGEALRKLYALRSCGYASKCKACRNGSAHRHPPRGIKGQIKERIRFLARASLLVVDEIGYLPMTSGGNLFFQFVNARCEKGAMILSSNRSFAEWGEVFGEDVVATALLDRLPAPSSSRSSVLATGRANTLTLFPKTIAINARYAASKTPRTTARKKE
jgi:hypothetical protein